MTNPDNTLAEAFGLKVAAEGEQTPTPEAADDAAPIAEATDDVEADLPEGEEAEAETDEVAEEAEEETEEAYTVKVDGEELKVSLSELKAGYMKDADYRKKTAELASQRTRVQEDAARFDKGIETLVKQLSIADQLVRDSFLNIDDNELDKLAVDNPQEYVRVKRIQEKAQNKLAVLAEQFQMAQAQRIEQMKAATEQHRKAERDALAQERPEFRKPETWDRLYSYLKGESYGFTQDVLDSVTDRRFVLLAEKARRYDALMAKGEERKVQAAPKVQKAASAPRAAQPDARQQDYQRAMAKVQKGDKAALSSLMAYL